MSKMILSEAVDEVNEAWFFSKKISASRKKELADFLASRQGLPGSYAGMFSVMPEEIKNGVNLFTGEKLTKGAAQRHIMGEEALRAFTYLNPKGKNLAAYKAAHDNIEQCLKNFDGPYKSGLFCCGRCSVSLWRRWMSEDANHKLIDRGIKQVKESRDGKGRWKRFPYYYTLLCLTEFGKGSALAEMKYAAKGCESLLKRKVSKPDKYTDRRKALAERVLSLV